MVTVIPVERKTAVLKPSSLACLSHIPTVNLTSGCAHGCLYCYTRGYSTHPGEGRILLYMNTLQKLRDEISRKRTLPRAIYFSPSSDMFQPVGKVLALAYKVLLYLFKKGIGVALLTKGRIPERHMRLLEANAPQVRMQIGLATLNENCIEIFEPHAAPADVRLAQAQRLVRAGIITQIRMDPILPGLTDDSETFHSVCASLVDIGVKQVAASTLFMRPAIVHYLNQIVPRQKVLKTLLRHFHPRRPLRIHAKKSSVSALPERRRSSIYNRLKAIAKGYGIVVRVCVCKNPDLATGSCNIAGSWNTSSPIQPSLFEE